MRVVTFCPSECDPLPGVQTGVYGGGCDGKCICDGLSGSSQQHCAKISSGEIAAPCGGSTNFLLTPADQNNVASSY